MIMKKVLMLLVCTLSVGLFHSCSEDLGESGIEIPEFNLKDLTPTDLYIYKNYTKPYNVEVIYRWKDSETDVAKNLVPPEEEKVEPFLEILKTVWIDTETNIMDRKCKLQSRRNGDARYCRGRA